MKKTWIALIGLLGLAACTQESKKESQETEKKEQTRTQLAKFEPAEGVLLFVGQELEAVGGLENIQMVTWIILTSLPDGPLIPISIRER